MVSATYTKQQNLSRKRKRTAPKKKNVKNLNLGRKKLSASDKGSWFNQDVFWDEIEEKMSNEK